MSKLSSYLPKIQFSILKHIEIKFPEVIKGYGSRELAGKWCIDHGYKNVLIVSDKNLITHGLIDKITDSLKENNIKYCIYVNVLPNPTLGMAYEAIGLGMRHNVDLVIGFGGGSVLDTAKLTAVGLATKKPLIKTLGLRNVDKSYPVLAIPTTAGTGSEVLCSVVISDDITHSKYSAGDMKLFPLTCIYDHETLSTLPPKTLAETIFDSLTHAIESFLTVIDNPKYMENAKESICLINKYAISAFNSPDDLLSREKLMEACYLSGTAVNTMGAGYTHALGHRLTELYNYVHGETLAILLPHVLQFSSNVVINKLATLAITCELGDSQDATDTLAHNFINRIIEIRDILNLPNKCDKLKKEDYPIILKKASYEADNTFAVPKYMNKNDIEEILNKILI